MPPQDSLPAHGGGGRVGERCCCADACAESPAGAGRLAAGRLVSPLSQHVPLEQVWPFVHGVPHAPQLLSSVLVSVTMHVLLFGAAGQLPTSKVIIALLW